MSSAAVKMSKERKVDCGPEPAVRPILILTIANGAAHTQAAKAIAAAWRDLHPNIPARIVEVSDYMSRKARFTHVTAYLWLVKNAPRVWENIDSYQKRQTQTSPIWFYRRECKKLFDLVREIEPSAIVATEVGCGEIASLIKRDLQLQVPLVAVSLDYDADRAWIQPEIDLYCLATPLVEKEFLKLGASPDKIETWGVPLGSDFKRLNEMRRTAKRKKVCYWLELDPEKPILLIAGGGEGLGKIEAVVNQLLHLPIQMVVLAGHNKKLKARCEKIGFKKRVRVLGWTEKVSDLMNAADILISKLGLTFYESMTCGLPIVALEPPPGAERIQHALLENFGVGRAVRSLEEMSQAVHELLNDEILLKKMREKTAFLGQPQASEKLVSWMRERI